MKTNIWAPGDVMPLFWTPEETHGRLPVIRVSNYPLAQSDLYFARYNVTLAEVLSAAPSSALLAWQTELPVDSVLAGNGFNVYSLTLFLPQQTADWPPIISRNFYHLDRLFPHYYRLLDRSLTRYKDQPFFNTRETMEERLEFVDDLHVTHIVLDPMCYRIKPLLQGYPQRFRSVFDDGQWVVFAVARK